MYYINIDQRVYLELGLNLEEATIVEYMIRATHWAKQFEFGGELYYQLHISKIIEDLPILGISTEDTMRRRINDIISKGVIFREVIAGNKPVYRVHNILLQGGMQNCKGGLADLQDNRVNYNNTNNIINNIISTLKEGKENIPNKKKKELIELLSLSGQSKTDLAEVSIEDVVAVRASQDKKYKLPVPRENTKMYLTLRESWSKIRKEYTKEEFNTGIENYLKDIDKRNPMQDYSRHRFSLFEFITQKNGLFKFANL